MTESDRPSGTHGVAAARSGDEQIPVFRPLIDDQEVRASSEALEMGWLGMGSYVADFEERLRVFLEAGDRHVVAVSTGHAALHLGLLAAGVGPGDEVITPSFNNVTDFQAILATGAEPVLCDIEDSSLCLDLDQVEKLITGRTKAMIAMDYANALCDHERVEGLAKRNDLRVIHDAAHSFGSRYGDRMVGSFSDITMFSFDPVKTITSIDGGALIVRAQGERDRLREMRLVGMGQPAAVMYQNQRAWTYDVREIGFRYHLSNLHAAIGLAQLGRMEQITATRRATCRYYDDAFARLPDVAVAPIDYRSITPFLYYVRVPETVRDDFRLRLAEQGVDTGLHWQPGHRFELLRSARRGDLTVTERVAAQIVSLPLHSMMAEKSQERVIEAVVDFFGGGS